ncbi:MAG: PH domain-containing protein [Pseudonocardiaceae bacterium]
MTEPAPVSGPAMMSGPEMAGWARLHPLSPLVRFGRAVGVLLAVGAQRLLWGGDRTGSWIEAAVLGFGVLGGVVFWLVTRWRVHDGELQIETGLFRRQSIRVPLRRIQAIDVVAPLVGRLLGMAEVRVEVAGRGSDHSRLAYLRRDEAWAVRARLLALAHGLPEETPAPAERPLLVMSNGRLVASAALGVPALLLVALVVVGVWNPPALPVVLPMLVGIGAVPVRRIVAEFGLSVAEAPDGLRLRSGLLQTRAETIPLGRVQAVRWIEPLTWRPFGWCRLEVDVARQRSGRHGNEGDSARVTRALLPAGSREQAHQLLARVLPGASERPPPGSAPPRRAGALTPLSWWALRAWHDERFLVTRSGRLWWTTVLVPLHKAQSVRWRQGPLQRQLRLATIEIDTAGRNWRAVARCRDAAEADELLATLPALARGATGPPSTGSSIPERGGAGHGRILGRPQ